jgi:hypothetical protein
MLLIPYSALETAKLAWEVEGQNQSMGFTLNFNFLIMAKRIQDLWNVVQGWKI